MASADFTIADVLQWARTKPAKSVYCYQETDCCALAQFLKETQGVKRPDVLVDHWRDAGSRSSALTEIPEPLAEALAPRSRYNGSFGALVRRLERVVDAEQVSA